MTPKNQKYTTTLDGNHAAAEAVRQLNPDVFGFYPITPTSYIGEKFSEFVANGEVDTEFVSTESEHAAMSVCVGAAAAGGRAVTATASQGLILMSEVLFNASGMRLPVVLINGNRALSAPLSIHGDHSDAMAVRDAGWVQIFAENPQEMYDFLITAPLIAETENVRTPVMVCMDCFQTTHTICNVVIESDAAVRDFVGTGEGGPSLLDLERPQSFGNFDRPDFYMEHRRAQLEGLANAGEAAKKIWEKFGKKFGRGSKDLVEVSGPAGAETAVVVLGAAAGTIRRAISFLESEKGQKVNLVRPKMFRPFPSAELKTILGNYKRVLVLDRTSPAGAKWGPLGTEMASLFTGSKTPEIKNAIFGIGQRETSFADFAREIADFENLPSDPKWINLRE